MKDLELWGGPECTLNRLADSYRDQFVAAGHYDRPDDLRLFAELGLAAIRYPVLWEKVAPDDPERCDWSWPDRQLGTLRASGTRVIAGLVHHGGGPRYAGLLDDGFAGGLAAFGGKVAERYPWIDDWTPVNEPLTTARFSALYGHWYPHHRDEASFWRALVNQIDGTRLAMSAIRRVNRHARLIQTDDLGRTFASFAMRDQAAFDNVRRWMSWDMLCGRVTPDHPLWERLAGAGLGDRLRAIADDPCPPAVIGVNHYLTSDRFLDHRVERYPGHVQGGNGRASYADVEALRVLDPAPPGLAGVLREAWERYRIPVAITEVHNGSTRDEQMRWMAAAWDTAAALRDEGVPVEAVTAWSLLGSSGWNTLLKDEGLYEPGVFDVTDGTPRPTAMVPLLRGLPRSDGRHPVVSGRGWWQRPTRLLHQAAPRPAPMREYAIQPAWGRHAAAPPLLIWGTDRLGAALARACVHRDIAHVIASGSDPEVRRDGSAAVLDRLAPWATVITEEDAAAEGVAELCRQTGTPCVRFADAATPIEGPGGDRPASSGLLIETGLLFSADDPDDFAGSVVRTLGAEQPFSVSSDRRLSPTYVPELLDRVLDLLIDGETGTRHVVNVEALSAVDFARRIAAACGLPEALVVPARSGDGEIAPQPAGDPHKSPLGPLEAALRHFADHVVAL